LLNPYLIIGLIVFWLASVGGAYFKGHTAAQDAARAQYATELEATIKQHNANTLIDMQAAADVAAKEAAARTRTAMLRNQTTKVIYEKPMPVSCNYDDGRMQLVAAAVAAANNEDTAARVRAASDKANATIR